MPSNRYFYYDEQDCKLVPLEYHPLEKFVLNFCLWILCGLVIAGVGITTLSFYVGTPSEIALKAENNELFRQLEETKARIAQLDGQLSGLADRDNDIYRTVLGIEPILSDERLAGTGGADVYSEFDLYREPTAEILKWTESNLDNLERRIGIQKLSFQEIQLAYNKNKDKLRHVPAIKPGKGVIISGFGMRFHPVLRYQRMHEGIDLRAKIGSPVYATGDGSIAYAGRKGNLGQSVYIDHGFGFETRYAHLSKFAPGVRKGKKILRGQLIGYSGNTGLVEGPHLHYEVLLNGRNVDPLNYLFGDISPEEYNMYKKIAEETPHSMD